MYLNSMSGVCVCAVRVHGDRGAAASGEGMQAVGAKIVASDGSIPFWGFIMFCGAVVYSAQLLIWAALWGGVSNAAAEGAPAAAAAEESERERLISS
eukprot:COSAG06_NODE_4045_length_4634_cov_7.279603_3_plen_97_part_00